MLSHLKKGCQIHHILAQYYIGVKFCHNFFLLKIWSRICIQCPFSGAYFKIHIINKALAYKREILDLGDGDPSLKYECACFSFLGICPIIGKAPKWPFSMCTVHWPEHPKGDCCNFLIRRLQR